MLLALNYFLLYSQLSAPLIPDVQFRFPYDAARALVVESVAPLGGAYQEAVRSGLYEDRWVDVYPNAGKRPGAYSAGIHETLSFIFLNYDDTLSGVLTLAHEVGHSAHALLARAAQSNHFSDAPYFVSGTSAGERGRGRPRPAATRSVGMFGGPFFCVSVLARALGVPCRARSHFCL